MRNSFVRILITITTILAIFALLFREWLYTYWMDFKDEAAHKLRYMELQKKIMEENSVLKSQSREKKCDTTEEKISHFKIWLK